MMDMSPWLSIVLLGVAITGYAWMIPKKSGNSKETEFVTEEAYDQLLEDLETENRELVDAVVKFKQEQDETVGKLGRRIVDMEHQMAKWLEQAPHPGSSSEVISIPAASDGPIPIIASVEQITPDNNATGHVDHVIDEDVVIPPQTIRERYPELLKLYDQGRSVEQIAKAAGMNKGEVQLILQLVRREEQHA